MESLFFYDLETSGLYPKSARAMQFAGQRADTDLNLQGDPVNVLISMSEDQLPDPASVLIHGITPQQTRLEGLTEAAFLRYFYEEIAIPGTVFVGFNNIDFDDEFMRYMNYRNLRDPYTWSYADGRSRWDILNVVRMTRALRPDGINWPLDADGRNINRLELLTQANLIEHDSAHDALSDSIATIGLARLVKLKQPRLYDYMYDLRDKAVARRLVESGQPFVYTSSHYPSAQYHTTAVIKVADHPLSNRALVFDLRYDPSKWLNKSVEELTAAWRYDKEREADNPPLPVETLRLNSCPAIAPLSVIKDLNTQNRLELSLETIEDHLAKLRTVGGDFASKIIHALEIIDSEQEERRNERPSSVEHELYAGFYSDQDRQLLDKIHQDETPENIRSSAEKFSDERLKELAGLYLARNYKQYLNESERKEWDNFVRDQLLGGNENSRLAVYFNRIAELAKDKTDTRSQILLEDLKLYGDALIPSDISD